MICFISHHGGILWLLRNKASPQILSRMPGADPLLAGMLLARTNVAVPMVSSCCPQRLTSVLLTSSMLITGAAAPMASFATNLSVSSGGGTPTTITQSVTPTNPAANAPVTVSGTITAGSTTPSGTVTITVSAIHQFHVSACAHGNVLPQFLLARHGLLAITAQ